MHDLEARGDAMPTATTAARPKKKTAKKRKTAKTASKPTSPTPEALLKPKAKPDIIELPARKVIAREGAGGPEEPQFGVAIGALYGVAYPMKFARKKVGRSDHKVGVLEGEWWAEGENLPVHEVPARETWRWRVQIAVPDDTTDADVQDAVTATTTKKGGRLEGSEEVKKVALVDKEAARFARILHKGSYATEPESFARMKELLDAEGLESARWHVEVYLSDPSRTAPDKLKTTLLLPLKT
jgi:hypothetical protein